MRNLDRAVRKAAMLILVAALTVAVCNLVAMAAAHIGPWAGVGVLVAFAALPFVPVRTPGQETSTESEGQ